MSNKIIELTRDCNAVLIPAGTPVLLQKGMTVKITQDLGGHVTVVAYDNLARIDASDVDALGPDYEPKTSAAATITPPEGPLQADFIRDCLRECYDPEIPVNIVDLGLIYDVNITSHNGVQYTVVIDMTLTAPGCGIGPMLVSEVESRIRAIAQVENVQVNLVFDPPWHQGLMSDEAKLTLNLF